MSVERALTGPGEVEALRRELARLGTLEGEALAAKDQHACALGRLLALFDDGLVSVAQLDEAGRIVSANRAFQRSLGRGGGSPVGKGLDEGVDPAVAGALAPQLRAAREGGSVSFALDLPLQRGGRESLRGTCFSHPSGGTVLLILPLAGDSSVDQSRLALSLQLERQLAREEQTQRLLAQASAVLGLSLDYQTNLRRVTQLVAPQLADGCAFYLLEDDGGLRRISSVRDRVQGALWRAFERRAPLVPGARAGPMRAITTGEPELIDGLETGAQTIIPLDSAFLVPHGEPRIGSAITVPMRIREQSLGAVVLVTAESGRALGAGELALAEDLSRRAAFAIENARLFRQAQEANRLKDEFLATVSHELRTPLNAMLGWAHMLRRGQLSSQNARRALDTIERNARAQAQIIEDLLDVSRIVTGKLRLDVTHVDLAPVLESAIDAVRPAANAKRISVDAVLDPAAGSVSGDPDRLQQVAWNLLSNAIKFTPEHGHVQVSLRRDGSSVLLRVSDTGKGIRSDFLPHVFDRFRQSDSSTTRAHGGLGLGLAIVRHLVEVHGGTVQAESAGEGCGASFNVRLPAQVVQLDLLDRSSHLPVTDGASVAEAPSLDGLDVLVIDDEPDARELLYTILDQRGARAIAVESVAEAMVVLEYETPAVVLCDIAMPGEDGFGFISRLRALERARGVRIPCAALTAYAGAQDRSRTLLAGFQMHIPKPVTPTELVAVVASLAGLAAG